ncbi:MAG TPA: sigma-70 family RNA polymerase sigma factor [Blastocatellia bacterium]
MTTSPKSITQLLIDWRDGDESARDKLFPLVYAEMRRLAHSYMRKERAGHTLQTSALINEAYIRLVDHKGMRWQNRAHFYAIAALAMRRILVDRARHHLAARHGGSSRRVDIDQAALVTAERAPEIIALDDALTALAALDARQAQIVEMRYFVGLSADETAEVLGVSPVTVNRDWRAAKLWLLKELQADGSK